VPNSVLQYYRSQNNDPRSDEAITLDLGSKYPELLQAAPDFAADYNSLSATIAEAYKPGIPEYTKEILGSTVRSAADVLASPFKAIGVGASALAKATGIPFGEPEDARETLSYKIGQGIDELAAKVTPEPVPELEGSFWANKLPSYVGSAAGFIAGGIGGRLVTGAGKFANLALEAGTKKLIEEGVVKTAAEVAADDTLKELAYKAAPKALKLKSWVADNAPIAALGSTAQGVSAYEEALSKGATHDQAVQNFLWNLPIGATEIIPLTNMLKRLDGISGGGFTKALIEGAKESFENGVQEAGQQLLQNVVAKETYDKDRDLRDELAENAAGGVLTGFLFSVVTHALGKAKGVKTPTPPTASQKEAESAKGTIPPPGGAAGGAAASPPATTTTATTATTTTVTPGSTPALPTTGILGQYTGNVNEDTQSRLAEWASQDIAGTLPLEIQTLLAQMPPDVQTAYGILKQQKQAQAAAAPTTTAVTDTGATPPVAGVTATTAAQPVPPAAPAAPTTTTTTTEGGVTNAEEVRSDTGQATPGGVPAQSGQAVSSPDLQLAAQTGTTPSDQVNQVTAPPSPQPGATAAAPTGTPAPPESPSPATTTAPAAVSTTTAPHPESIAAEAERNPALKQHLAELEAEAKAPGGKFDFQKGVVTADEEANPHKPWSEEWNKHEARPPNWKRFFKGAKVGAVAGKPFVLTSTNIFLQDAGRWVSKTLFAVNDDGTRATLQDNILRGQAQPLTEHQLRPEFGLEKALEELTKEFGGKAHGPTLELAAPPSFSTPQAVFDQTDFAGHPWQEQKHGITKEPAFFRVTPEEAKDVKKLGERLTANAAGANVQKKSLTRQLTFFLDNITGRVFGLGTYKTAGKVYVGRLQGDAKGSQLGNFLAKETAGAPRYTVLGAVTLAANKAVDSTNDQHGIVFKDQAAFEEYAKSAEEILGTEAAKTAAVEGEKTTVEGGEGEQKTVTPVEPTTPADELLAKEGFTEDEASSLFWSVRKTGDPIVNITKQAHSDEDVRVALQKIVTLFTTHGAKTEEQIVAALRVFIVDSKTKAGGSKEEFAKHLTSAIREEAARNFEGFWSSTGRAQKTAATTTTSGSVSGSTTGAKPGAAGVAGQTAQSGAGGAAGGQTTSAQALTPEQKAAKLEELKKALGMGEEEPAAPTALKPGDFVEVKNAKGGGSFVGRVEAVLTNNVEISYSTGIPGEPRVTIQVKAGDILRRAGGGEVRGHRGTIEPNRATSNEVTSAFNATVNSLANAGYNVTIVHQEAAGMVQEMGAIDNATQTVTMVLSNVTEPTLTNLYHLNAEVSHAVFAQLPAGEQALLQDAIKGATDDFLGITAELPLSKGVPAEQRSAVQQEERLVDTVAKRITAAGFNPARARGLAQAFWRFLKNIYYRAALAMQRAWFGKDMGQRGAELATAYLQNRVESFLAGNVSPLSFTSFMGGPAPKITDRTEWGRGNHANGFSALTWFYNPRSGGIEVQEADPDTAAAVFQNLENATIRYHAPRTRNQPGQPSADVTPAIVTTAIAANNEFNDFITKAFADYNAQGNNIAGQTFDDFKAEHMPSHMDEPVAMIATLRQGVANLGQTPPPANQRMATLNEATRREVAIQAAGKISKWIGNFFAKVNEARADVDVNQSGAAQRVIRNVSKINDATQRYQDAHLAFADLKKDVLTWIKWLRTNAGNAAKLAAKEEQIAGVIEVIEGKLDQPIAGAYATAMDRLARAFTGVKQESFISLIRYLADNPNFVWSDMSVKEIKDTLRDTLNGAINPNAPMIDELRADTEDGKALLSIVTLFLKRNDLAVQMLGLSAEQNYEDKLEINAALKVALSDQKEAFRMARNMLTKQNRAQIKARRLLDKLEAYKKQQYEDMATVERAKNLLSFYYGPPGAPQVGLGEKVNEYLAPYEREIGAVDEHFEALPGSEMLTVVTKNDDLRTIMVVNPRQKYQVQRDGAENDQLKRSLQLMKEWIDAHGPGTPEYGSAVYNRLATQIAKLRENKVQSQMDRGVTSFMQRNFGNMAKVLDMTGLPEMKAFARQLRDWVRNHFLTREADQVRAVKWSTALNKAIKAFPGFSRKHFERFLEQYYDAALDYISRRADLMVGPAGETEDTIVNRQLAAVRTFFNLPGHQWAALENLLRTTFDINKEYVTFIQENGGKIKDDDLNFFRSFRGLRSEVGRTFSALLHGIYTEMQHGNGIEKGAWATSPMDVKTLASEYENRPALAAKLAPLFTKNVWDRFLAPLARRPGQAAFDAVPDHTGFTHLATVQQVTDAFNNAPVGDVLKFAENLFDATAPAGPTFPPERAAFVAKTLGTIQTYYDSIHGAMSDQANAVGKTVVPVQHLMMDARKMNELPKEWVRYHRYDIQGTRALSSQLALHLAFGRNMEVALKEFQLAKDHFSIRSEKLGMVRRRAEEAIAAGTITKKDEKAYIEAQALAEGFTLAQLNDAARILHSITKEEKNFLNWVKLRGGVLVDFRPFAEAMQTMTTAVLQGPKTAFFDTTAMFKPLQIYGGFSKLGWEQTAKSVIGFGKEAIGSFLQAFNITMNWEAEHIAMWHELNQQPHADVTRLKDRILAAALAYPADDAATILQKVGRGVSILSRVSREIISSPVPTPAKGSKFTKLKFALFNLESSIAHAASVRAVWSMTERLVTRAAKWIENQAPPGTLNDPTFQFDGSHARLFNLGQREFERYIAMLEQHGGLTLEDMAKDYIGRGTTGQVLTKEQYQHLLVIGPTEITGESSIATRPSALASSAYFGVLAPLTGWAIGQMASLDTIYRDQITGERHGMWLTLQRGLFAALPLVGVALAYSLLADRWDEDVLKKKANRMSLWGDNLAMAMLDRVATVGSLGIIGDAANAYINQSTARPFTVDSRVFFVNSLTSIMDTMGGWIFHQGGPGTYATVYRPLFAAMGGSGALQWLDALNGIFGFDNAEARVTARLNVNNWLRVAGRAEQLPVRKGASASGDYVPNRTTPYIREMMLSALANDSGAFAEAYADAIAAAKEDGRVDAKDYVRRAFSFQHPLRSVFQTPPSSKDYHSLLRALPDNGQQAVTESIRLFNRYGERLGIAPFTGQPTSSLRPDRTELLRRQAGEVFSLQNALSF